LQLDSLDRFVIQGLLWVISSRGRSFLILFGTPSVFDCRTPYDSPNGIGAIARIGAFDHYTKFFKDFSDAGIDLVNSPEQYQRCTSLPVWYPLISDLTPRSKWYESIPRFEGVKGSFGLPVFCEGR